MLNLLPYYMVRCLLLTILLECGSAYLIGYRKKTDQIFILLAQVMTNPVVVVSTFLVGFFFGRQNRMILEIVMELLAVVSEGYVYSKTLECKRVNPFVLSLILNGISYASGFLVNAIL